MPTELGHERYWCGRPAVGFRHGQHLCEEHLQVVVDGEAELELLLAGQGGHE